MHTQHDLTLNLNNKSDFDFSYPDIGFCQKKSLMSPDITANQLSVMTSGNLTNNQGSEELKFGVYQNRLTPSNQLVKGEMPKDDRK